MASTLMGSGISSSTQQNVSLQTNGTMMANVTPPEPTIPPMVPQGPGSQLNADLVDGINATTIPMPNNLLPLGPTGQFPVSVIPAGGGGGSGFLLGDGAPTLDNILVANGTLWESVTMSGDATITSDTGALTLATVNTNVGSFGLPGSVPVFTVNGKGLITAAANESIFIDADQIADATGSGASFTTYSTTVVVPQGIAFDGTNMWLAAASAVCKVTPSGSFTNYGTFSNASAIAFDGTNMWVTDNSAENISKVTPSGGITSYSTSPFGGVSLAFDGTNMWAGGGSFVAKVTPSGGVTLYSYAGSISRIAFDGTNMWGTDNSGSLIVKFVPAGTYTTYPSTGVGPYGIAFDGTNMWVSNIGDDSLDVVNSAGTVINHYTGLPSTPRGLAFDGINMWTANYTANSATRVDPTGGLTTISLTSGTDPYAITKNTVTGDMWTANLFTGTTKIIFSPGIGGILNAQIDPNAGILVTKLAFNALGDIVFGSTAGAATILSGNTSTTKEFLTQAGTGSVSAAPTWSTIVAGDIPTSLPSLVTVGTLTSLVMGGTLKVFGDTTGSGTVTGFGTNCPATTLTSPYTWVKLLSSDGSTVWLAGYK